MSSPIRDDVPFSLSCTECDIDSPKSYEDAIEDGWTGIEYFPQGLMENYLGLCSDCRKREEEEERQLRK